MIKYIDYFIPEERIQVETVFDLVEDKKKLPSLFETKDDGVAFFKNVLNLSEVANAGTTSEVDLLHPVLSRFFDKNMISPKEVDLVILIDDQLGRGTRMSNLGHYIQHTYNLKKADLIVFSGNHCANIEYAIVNAENILKLGEVQNILILAVNKIADQTDRLVGSYAVMGDAASLVYLNGENTNGIRLNGKYSFTNGILHEESNIDKDNSLLLTRNYMLCLSGLMKKYKLKPVNISDIIVQNANPLLVTQCLTSLGFKSDQIFADHLASYGHLDCIDFLVNLKSLMTKKTNSSDKIIAFGIGSAGSYISLYLEIIQ